MMKWATPTLFIAVALAVSACADPVHPSATGDCPPGGTGGAGSSTATTGAGTSASAGATTSAGTGTGSTGTITPGSMTAGNNGNTFDHFNDPGASGQKDPFEIQKEHDAEGTESVRARMHSCSKLSYAALGDFLMSRGVNLNATSSSGPKTAGELYSNGGDTLGAARFDFREGETYFHTTAGATKLFDIFVQAAPEIIANIASVEACKLNGVGKPMFDATTGECVYESLSCIMGRPAKADDLTLCNLMLAQAKDANTDLNTKRNITVAAFLSAAHTCE